MSGNRSTIKLVGNTTQGQNLGGGAEIFIGKSGGNLLQFRSISATGTSIQIHQVGDRILVSGATGGGGSYNFINGLSESGDNVCLGGTLTQDTTISGSTHKFNVCSSEFNVVSGSYVICSGSQRLCFGTNGVVFTETCEIPDGGIKYFTDYSGFYTDRSLVDRGYVDSYNYWDRAGSILSTKNVGDCIQLDNSSRISWNTTPSFIYATSGASFCALYLHGGSTCNFLQLQSNGFTTLTTQQFSINGNIVFNPANRLIQAGGTNNLTIKGGDSGTATNARDVLICGGFNALTGAGGNSCIFGGNSCCGTGGNVYIQSGCRICDTTYGNTYLCNLPSKGAETCTVFIDSTGKLSTGVPSSDCRLKCNIQPISNSTSLLSNICGYSAEFNEISRCHGCCEYVFLAQEIEKQLPLAVKDSVLINDENYKLVEYNQLIPVLWNIVKEQEIRIKELENKIK